MRQGGSPPTGNWQGSATGGVKAPQPVLLPNATTRFAATAARLDMLARDNPMPEWLRFMAHLARAQHAGTVALSSLPPLEAASVEQAVAAHLPPLAADSHHRDALWGQALAVILDNLGHNASLARLAPTLEELRAADEDSIEALASAFLHGEIDAGDTAKSLYVAAALQVYFTCLASTLPAAHVHLLPNRGQCPSCGSTPVSGVITATGDTPGTRYLYCSLCSTAWNHVRAVCITCASSEKIELRSIEGGSEAIKAEVCRQCRTYAKMLYQLKDMQLDPFADDLATLGLDIMMAEEGWERHAPNPLLLVAKR